MLAGLQPSIGTVGDASDNAPRGNDDQGCQEGRRAAPSDRASHTAATIRASNTGGGPAAEFDVTTGHAPFTGNSTTEVANLNAATLQGTVPADFYAAGSTVANSSQLGGQPPSFYLPATGTAANSSELGGLPASAYGDRWFAVVPAAGGLPVGNGVSSTQHDGCAGAQSRHLPSRSQATVRAANGARTSRAALPSSGESPRSGDDQSPAWWQT